jgi:hypothetical protein
MNKNHTSDDTYRTTPVNDESKPYIRWHIQENTSCVFWCLVFFLRLLVLSCMCRLVYGFYSSFTGVVLYVSSDVWFLFIVYWCCPVCVIWCMVFIHRFLVFFCMCRLVYGFYSSFTDKKPYTRRHIQDNTSKRWIKTIHHMTHTEQHQ